MFGEDHFLSDCILLIFMVVYKLSVPDSLLHFSELIIGDVIFVVCNDLPWLLAPLLEVEPDFLAGLLQLMISSELWHKPILRRFRSTWHLQLLMQGAVGAWSKVQNRCVIERTTSESLVAGPRCLDISGPALGIRPQIARNVQNPGAFSLGWLMNIKCYIAPLSRAWSVLASSHTTGGTVTHQEGVAVGSLLRLMIL